MTNTATPNRTEETVSGVVRDNDRGRRQVALRVAAFELSAGAARRLEEVACANGVLDSMGAIAPRLWPRIDLLRDEHPAIRYLASALHHYARTQAPEGMVSVMLTLLSEALSVHEALVGNLVLDALLTDLGGEGG